jgi:hypothetical protein
MRVFLCCTLRGSRSLSCIHCDHIRLLDRTSRRTIRDIHAREFERPLAIVSTAGIELRGMIREGDKEEGSGDPHPMAHSLSSLWQGLQSMLKKLAFASSQQRHR